MNKKQIEKLDNLILELNFDLVILNSAVKDYDDLEACMLDHFVEKIYLNSKEIRNIFENELDIYSLE